MGLESHNLPLLIITISLLLLINFLKTNQLFIPTNEMQWSGVPTRLGLQRLPDVAPTLMVISLESGRVERGKPRRYRIVIEFVQIDR
jgi:hypothetical protein